MRDYYARHPEKQRERVRVRSARIQDEIRELLHAAKDVPCTDCGVRYPPYVMDFDHVRGVKIIDLSNVRRAKWSFAKIQEEIDKCEVVCANCHRIRTHAKAPLPSP